VLIPAIALSAVALSAAACSGTATASEKAASSSASAPSGVTTDQARQVFSAWVGQDASVLKADSRLAGVKVTTASLASINLAVAPLARGVAYHQVADAFLAPHPKPYTYSNPSFIVPAGQTGYPRWFAVSAQAKAPAGAPSSLAGVPEPAKDQTLLTFEKTTPRSHWQLATSVQLQPGQKLPALAATSGGAQVALLDDSASYLTRPDMVGPLQAAVVDDGPSAPAAAAVASGPLTTGLYATESAIKPPAGDVRQWYL
jgi:hypothetical protein